MGALPLALASLLAGAPAVLERHQCHRCHEVEGLAPMPTERSCSGCHQDIASAAEEPARMAKGREEYGEAWDRFVERTSGLYCHLPRLAAMRRFRASWLEDFLRAPYDLRPNLEESMIRHNLTEAEIDSLVAAWGAARDEPPPRPSAEQLRRGARLFDEKGCGSCHLFGNRPFPVAQGFQFELLDRVRARALAPDLRHTRDRLNWRTVEELIRDPQAVVPHAEMPRAELSAGESRALADFVYFAEPGRPASVPKRRPPPARGGVPSYREVEEKVFRQVCWHCHSNPELAGGDGGPGNSGGFGFPEGGLSFASYEEVMSGSLGPDGRRRSIFRPGASGEPVLLERLRLRYLENDRDFVRPGEDDLADRRTRPRPRERGMPLGLPALTDEQFSLVERWIKGGRKP